MKSISVALNNRCTSDNGTNNGRSETSGAAARSLIPPNSWTPLSGGLEKKLSGCWRTRKREVGTNLTEWMKALWKDDGIQAAWPVAAKEYAFVDYEKAREKAEKVGDPTPIPPKAATDFTGFSRKFKQLIDNETVPADFPFGTDFSQLAKSLHKTIPAQLKKVRGKLNVPRERFHSVGSGLYKWAGLQFSKG